MLRAGGQKSNLSLGNICIIIVFALILFWGLAVVKDYGISSDEMIQRQHSLVNYQYVNETLFDREIDYIKDQKDVVSGQPLPKLDEYFYRFYGVSLQLPMVAIEDANGFQMNNQDIILMRHTVCFILFFIALICFYLTGLLLFSNKWLALTGSLMIFLFPRFFAEAFYNIKDMAFVSMLMISLFFMIKMLKTGRKWNWALCFAASSALTFNIRILGAMLPAAAFVFMIVEDLLCKWSNEKSIRTELQTEKSSIKPQYRWIAYPLVFFAFLGIFILITPASWMNPIDYLKGYVGTFSDFPWEGQMVFAGQYLSVEETPWYYIPVWMGITLPILYLVFGGIGIFFLVRNLLRYKLQGLIKERYYWIMLLLFVLPFVIGIMLHVTVYCGWRHVYFLVPPFVLIAVYGIGKLQNIISGISWRNTGKWILPVVIISMFLFQTGWIVYNHPYQNVFFNVIGRPIANQYDRDYWRLSNKGLLEYILGKYEGNITVLDDNNAKFTAQNVLPEKMFNRLSFVEAAENPDFILNTFRLTKGDDYIVEGYTEDYAIWVGGVKIGSILKNNNL